MRLTDEVRSHCAGVAQSSTSVWIHPANLPDAAPAPAGPPEPEHHFVDGSREELARYVLTLTAINFGSGWWPTIRKREGMSGYFTMATGLTEHFRAHGPWSNGQLRRITADELADVFRQDRHHELMTLYADALRQLGRWLGERPALAVVGEAGSQGESLAEALAAGMAYFDDRGFYKRAQIAVAELQRFGVAQFADLHRLTLFADNLVPHVLRVDGVLAYSGPLSEAIDSGRLLPSGNWEREIRACAVHAVEMLSERTRTPAHQLDMALWSRGQDPAYKASPRHRHRTVFY